MKAYPNLGSVTVQANIGNSVYNSLQAEFERRLTNGLQFRASYTFSRSIDNSPGAFDAVGPQDIRNLHLERAISGFDATHVLVASGLYELPFGKGKQFGKSWSGAVDEILGGWQLNGIFTASSGLPFSVYVGGTERADLITPSRFSAILAVTHDHVLCGTSADLWRSLCSPRHFGTRHPERPVSLIWIFAFQNIPNL